MRSSCVAWTQVLESFLSYPKKEQVAVAPILHQEYQHQGHTDISAPNQLQSSTNPPSTNIEAPQVKNIVVLPARDCRALLQGGVHRTCCAHLLSLCFSSINQQNSSLPTHQGLTAISLPDQYPQLQELQQRRRLEKTRVARQARACRPLLQEGVIPYQRLTVT